MNEAADRDLPSPKPATATAAGAARGTAAGREGEPPPLGGSEVAVRATGVAVGLDQRLQRIEDLPAVYSAMLVEGHGVGLRERCRVLPNGAGLEPLEQVPHLFLLGAKVGLPGIQGRSLAGNPLDHLDAHSL